MIILLLIWQVLSQGSAAVRRLLGYFLAYWKFWVVSGSIGFGGFYSLICFSADHAPGWVIATTWQLTIMASLFVLTGFGRALPKRAWLFSLIVFCGVVMVNVSEVKNVRIHDLWMGGFPVVIAAFCYPTGNQLVWEAKNGHRWLPHIEDPLLENPFNKVFLLSMGSVPFWAVLLLFTSPSLPSAGQLINTALVALFSGVLATSLFLHARNKAQKASELAAVDATQSSEVIFALIGEMVILGAVLPKAFAFAGIGLVFCGLGLYMRFQKTVV
jgi:drug/metabolite transporter (DMT)-like permease